VDAPSQSGQKQPDQKQRVYPMLGVFAVLLGASLATFFGRLLSVGLPDLRGALSLNSDSAAWIGTTYNMGQMFIGPFSVFLGGLLGPRRVLLASACIFTGTCVLMPFAGHLWLLLALLALAGLTAGTFYPLSLSFILRNLPQSYLHFGIAAYAIDIVVTTHAAHSYEGWLMNALSWRWLFWTTAVVTPIMIALVVYGIPKQPLPKPKPGQPPLSWRSFLYVSLGAALLYGALDQGQRLDWWRSGIFVSMFVSGGFLVAAGLIRHFCRPNPLVNYPFIGRRNTLLLGFTVMLFRFVLLSGVVLIPSYLAVIQGYRPEETGSVLLWLAIPQFLAGVLAVYLLGRIDARIILATGFALVAIGCFINAHITSLWSGNSFDVSEVILAMGEGLAFNGMVGSIILDVLNSGGMQNPASVLTFGGFFQTIRLFGGELGSSFIGFFLHNRQVFHYDLLAAGIHGGSEPVIQRAQLLSAVLSPHATSGAVQQGSAQLLLSSVQQQAYTLSIMDSFTLIAYAATAGLFVVICLHSLKVGFPQIIAASMTAKSRS
jgi:MFS transporter, DHA2 family, multidrug resistance protein